MNILQIGITTTLLAANLYGIWCGMLVMGHMFASRKVATTLYLLWWACAAMVFNAACWVGVIVLALIWPSESDSSSPVLAQVAGIALFMGASIGITAALHLMRRSLLTPEKREA